MGSVNNAIRAIILALVGCLPSSAWSQVSIQDKTNVVVLKQAPARPAGTAVALLASAPTDRPCLIRISVPASPTAAEQLQLLRDRVAAALAES